MNKFYYLLVLLAAAFWAPRDTCPERYFITLLLIQLAYLLGMRPEQPLIHGRGPALRAVHGSQRDAGLRVIRCIGDYFLIRILYF